MTDFFEDGQNSTETDQTRLNEALGIKFPTYMKASQLNPNVLSETDPVAHNQKKTPGTLVAVENSLDALLESLDQMETDMGIPPLVGPPTHTKYWLRFTARGRLLLIKLKSFAGVSSSKQCTA